MSETVNILLIDDDSIDVEGIKRAFKKAQINNPLYRAKHGLEALDMLRGQNGFEAIPAPYLLLVDINMPCMDGIEFLKELRQDTKLKNTIAFILTTSNADSDKLLAYELNVAGYIVKSNAGKGFMDMLNLLNHYWKVVEFP